MVGGMDRTGTLAAPEDRQNLTSLLVYGTTSDEALGLALRQTFDAAIRFLQDVPPSFEADPFITLVVNVHEKCYPDRAVTVELWARALGLPVLSVEWRSRDVLIGPLALPGAAGCWNCAHTRVTSAFAGAQCVNSEQAESDPLNDFRSDAIQLLVTEIQAIMLGRPAQSRLLDHLLICDAKTGRETLHRVIPLSQCAICGGASIMLNTTRRSVRPSAEDSPEAVLQALAGWVDRRTGVVSQLTFELSGDAGTELPIIVTASPPYVARENGSLRRLPIGWGKGLTVSGAILSAVGEAIERYSASLPDSARIIWNRPDDLDGEFLDPRTCGLYTEAQYECRDFPYARFDPTVQHPWILGRWLGSDAPVWIPAVFTYLAMKLRPEQKICQGTSNGLAASTDLQDAAQRATLELVERDAFLAAWFTGSAGRRIEIGNALDPQLREVLHAIESLGAEVELYTLPTSTCGTTALCLALGDGVQYPGATIGLGADIDPLSAIRQAILELAQTGPLLRRMMRSGLPVPDGPSAVREMLQHATYYFPVHRVAAFDRLRSSDAPVPLCDIGQGSSTRTLERIASKLAAGRIRVALVEVTSPDVATGPFRVVRAVSPDLQTLSYGYGFDRQPTQRIRALGLTSILPDISPIW
jgi:ribosomal protein S12 methylthiotransferase accessory factor